MTRAAVCVSARKFSEPVEERTELRSFNCMYLISGSGSSNLVSRLEILCAVLFRAILAFVRGMRRTQFAGSGRD